MRGDKLPAFAAVVYGGLGADGELAFILVLGSMTNSRLLKFWLPVSEKVNCESLTVVIFPETEEGSGKLLRGASSAGMGTDHKEIGNTTERMCDRNGSAKTHDGIHLQYHGFRLGR